MISDKKGKKRILLVRVYLNSEITNRFHLSCQLRVLGILEHCHEKAYGSSSGSQGETARILCPSRVTKEEAL